MDQFAQRAIVGAERNREIELGMGTSTQNTNRLRFGQRMIERLSANGTGAYLRTFKRIETGTAHRNSRESNQRLRADAAIRRKKDNSEAIERGTCCIQE